MQTPRTIVPGDNILGEGPVWDPRAGRLWWFDILGSKLFWTLSDGAEHGAVNLPMRASVAAPMEDGTLLIASERGLFRFDRGSGEFDPVVQVPDWPPGFRSNDGKADMDGRLWWSAMDDDGGTRPGFVYRYDRGINTLAADGVHIANSMAFSPNGQTFYLSDSKLKTIFAYDLDAGGSVRTRRVFARFKDGEPDGAAVDCEGHLWVAVWDGWRLERIAPDGSVRRVIEMPVQRPTACIFGGPDLSTLYITTARVGLSERDLSRQPQAGSLLAIQTDVKGVTIPPIAL